MYFRIITTKLAEYLPKMWRRQMMTNKASAF